MFMMGGMSIVEFDVAPAEDVPFWVGGPNVWGDRLGDGFVEVTEAVSRLDDTSIDRRMRVLDERGRRLEAERAVSLAEAERRKSYRGDHHAVHTQVESRRPLASLWPVHRSGSPLGADWCSSPTMRACRLDQK